MKPATRSAIEAIYDNLTKSSIRLRHAEQFPQEFGELRDAILAHAATGKMLADQLRII